MSKNSPEPNGDLENFHPYVGEVEACGPVDEEWVGSAELENSSPPS